MKVRVVPNGVDTDKFKPIDKIKAVDWFVRKFGVELHDDLNVVYVGRFSEEKGVVYLIRSLKYLDCKLFLVGGGYQEKELRLCANKFGNRVVFLGKVSHDEIPFVLNAMDVFVLPSISMEGFSNSMLEALACGLPVVVTPVGASPEVITSDIGTIVEVGNPKAIAEGINVVRDLNRGRIHEITRRKYSFSVVAKKVYTLYSEILGYPPKSICFASLFAPPYELSGIGMQVFELSKALSKYCKVSIVCGIGSSGILDGVNIVKVKCVDGLLSRPIYSTMGILKILQLNEFDIVDGRNWEGGLIAVFAKRWGAKAVMSLRGEGAIGEALWKRWINRYIMKRVDCVTATDTRTAKMAENLL